MRITKLRLTGFKSFVEPAELLIEPGLTGVVGPNGCGKSNLLEAMRWAMGESSAKSLRGGGMEDVIFAGTATRAPRDFAEVTIVTDGAEGEREVVRRVERGAGSAYRINGRDARARDVALLFADAATGAHSPALVSQGRIAAVIAAKPAERRQMLEEAAGIAGLHVRRREAEGKLRATEVNLARLDELMADMAGRSAALRRQARVAGRYRALSAEIRLAEARHLFARWREAAADAERARAAALAAEASVTAAGAVQRDAAGAVMTGIARAAEARAAAEAQRETAGAARRQVEGLRAERDAATRRLGELEHQAAALAADRAREDELSMDAAAAIARLEEEAAALGATIAEAERERDTLSTALGAVEALARDAEVAVAQAHARAAAEQAETRVAQAALAAARQQAARVTAERARLEREAAALGDVQALTAASARATATRGVAETGAAAAARRLAKAERVRDSLLATRQILDEAAAQAGAALAQFESEQRALAASLAKAEGRSLLSRLTVAPGFEHALAAALGEELEAPPADGGPRYWSGAAPLAGDPPLPPDLLPLAAVVTGGGEVLARRLAQVGVADEDDGRALAVGQRLVTRDGRMRRWDGFVARDAGAAAAERLVRVNRLGELDRAAPPARAEAERAREAVAAATAQQAEARAAADQGRRALSAAEEGLRQARRAEDAAQAAEERHAAALRLLTVRRDALEPEERGAAEALLAAERQVAALPDGAAAAAAVRAAEAAASAARAALGEQRGRSAALAEAITRDTRRQAAARAEARGWLARSGDAAARVAEMTRRVEEAASERASLDGRPEALARSLREAEVLLTQADTAVAQHRAAEGEADAALRQVEVRAAQAAEALATAREARAGAVARAEAGEARRAELSREAGERFACPAATLAERAGFNPATLGDAEREGQAHARLLAERERMGPVNLVAETELAELEATHATATAEREELGEAVNRLRGSIGSLNREGRQRLVAAFEAVDGHFRRLFTRLFAGGEAHLSLVDAEDPLEAGLEIMAQPPGKKLGSLTLLSGGEQALTAVALVFALFLTNPAPICVLDEVDAPLDDANIERFCDLLVAMTGETETRYLIVTHNPVTMSRMDRLFGVTMIERGISRLVSVDLGGAERLLAAE